MILRPEPNAPAMFYVRSACIPQAGASGPSQEAVCRRLIADLDLAELGGRTDVGVSGSAAADRPGLRDVMALARRSAFRVLVTTSLDRLSSNPSELQSLIEELIQLGVILITVDEGPIDAPPPPPLLALKRRAETLALPRRRRHSQAQRSAGACEVGRPGAPVLFFTVEDVHRILMTYSRHNLAADRSVRAKRSRRLSERPSWSFKPD